MTEHEFRFALYTLGFRSHGYISRVTKWSMANKYYIAYAEKDGSCMLFMGGQRVEYIHTYQECISYLAKSKDHD